MNASGREGNERAIWRVVGAGRKRSGGGANSCHYAESIIWGGEKMSMEATYNMDSAHGHLFVEVH